MRSACRSAAGLPPWATLPARTWARLRATATEIAGKVPIRIMRLITVPDLRPGRGRLRAPPSGRYWYQKVLRPLARMRTPKPLTSPSQRKTWPAGGQCARSTAASVSRFFAMVAPQSDSASTALCTTNFVWRATEQYGEICRKIKATRGDVPGFVWRALAAQGAARSLIRGERSKVASLGRQRASRERDGLFDMVKRELPRTGRRRAASSAVLILRSAHPEDVRQTSNARARVSKASS